jgi:hypothetical protein
MGGIREGGEEGWEFWVFVKENKEKLKRKERAWNFYAWI